MTAVNTSVCERINSVCRQAQIEGTSYGKIMSKGVRK